MAAHSRCDGTISNTSGVTVNSSATLTGIGTIDPPTVSIASGAMFAPGAAGIPGTSMTIAGNFAFESGAYLRGAAQWDEFHLCDRHRHGVARRHRACQLLRPASCRSGSTRFSTSAGLDNTTFSGLIIGNQPSGFDTSLAYTTDDVPARHDRGARRRIGTERQSAKRQPVQSTPVFNNGGSLPTNFCELVQPERQRPARLLCRNSTVKTRPPPRRVRSS